MRRFCEGDDLTLLFVAPLPSPPLAVCGAIVLPFAATAALKCLTGRGIPLASSKLRGVGRGHDSCGDLGVVWNGRLV
jgi:hypothetical protein